MSDLPIYSSIFSCLYDEQGPVGRLGRGTHYSVFRSVEWLDVEREQLSLPQIHDFTVVWDEDHDTRVIEAIEKIYMAGLLSPVQFIGERKGTLTIILAARYYWSGTDANLEGYKKAVTDICRDIDGDYWPVEVGSFDRSPGSPHQCDVQGIIADSEFKVLTYLRNIDSLWGLGTKEYKAVARGFYA